MAKPSPLPLSLLCAAVVAVVGLVSAGTLQAQDPAQAAAQQLTGRPVSQDEILQRLKSSGLTREQAHERLKAAGYDPGLLDSYFDRLGGRSSAGELKSPSSFGAALSAIGLMSPPEQTAPPAAAGDTVHPWATPAPAQSTLSASPGEPEVFGRSLFSGLTTQFALPTTGPVDRDYRLGPGDQLQIVLTGDVEQAYSLEVNREGSIVLPDVGMIVVNGLTLDGLDDVLYERLGRVYSGVRRGKGATTHFQVSLGRLRTNLVYLVGEVTRPGAYQVSAVATAIHALYQAGGPNARGSFRSIEIRRGGQVVTTVDLYEYILSGASQNDVRLEQGDVLYVPLAGPQVTVSGSVRRPAIFELKNGEDLHSVLGFAGGFEPKAFVRRLQIDRILPPAERRPGHERVLVDVDLPHFQRDSSAVALAGGDVVRVFSISDERRNQVTVRGEVNRPGTYEYAAGMRAWDLIQRASGLLPDAYSTQALVVRMDLENGTRRLIPFSLRRDSTGKPLQDPALSDLDEVVIFGRSALGRTRTVTVSGPVRHPGKYPFADGMTIKDLILEAGGTLPNFFPQRAHVSRLEDDFSRSLMRVDLKPDALGVPQGDVRLAAEDEVRIYSREELLTPASVRIEGAVKHPGEFPMESGMSVADLVLAAGGLRKGAMSYEVEVARPRRGESRSDTLVSVYRTIVPGVALDGGDEQPGATGALVQDDGTTHGGSRAVAALSMSAPPSPSAAADWRPSSREMTLQDGDVVFVRISPGFTDAETVDLQGEIMVTGPYALRTRNESVSSVIRRAGGLTKQAYAPGARLLRDSVPVALNLTAAMKHPGGRQDLPLRPGDVVEVPLYDPTVTVSGAVAFKSRVPYKEGADLAYYIQQAGGYVEDADRGRVAVTQQNGSRGTVRHSFLFTSRPTPGPGSTVTVPTRSKGEGFNLDRVLSRTMEVVTTAATLLVMLDRLK